jgi:hypothetical protein
MTTSFRPPLADPLIPVAKAPSHDADGRPLIIDDVSLTRLPSGDLLAMYTHNRDSRELSHPRDGGRLTVQWSNPFQLRVSKSSDDGATWHESAPLDLNMGMPFVHDGRLYLIANELGRKNIVVLASDDEGESWSAPVLLAEGNFWNTPAGMAVHDGRIYRGMGTTGEGPGGGGWNGLCVLAGDLGGDLLDPASWRLSEPVYHPGVPDVTVPRAERGDRDATGELLPGNWLEANVIEVGGTLKLIAVTRQVNTVGVCDVVDDGTTLGLVFDCFYPVPGGHAKMFIIRDDVTGLFWSQCNIAPDPLDLTGWNARARATGYTGEPALDRHILTTVYSVDGLNWFQAGAAVIGERRSDGFQYIAPLIDGDDLLYASRTGLDDAANQHDANRVTLHRIRGFRALAHRLTPDEVVA